ncbi:MAG: hypothetical protein M3P06_20065 [Acidobacteriota bacterium]|nr:hypothetical protein [Acidobacteriota bacterium]
MQHFRSLAITIYDHYAPSCEHLELRAMLCGLQWRLRIFLVQLEQFRGSDALSGEAAASRRDGCDTAPGRLHPPHPDPQEMLAAVPGLAREVRRLDAPAPDE